MQASAKRTMIRANKAQTTILQDAFAQSNTISPGELKSLSEKTALPEKWIHQWFARRRVKARKTPIDPGPVTSSSDLVPSPQEMLKVKIEHRDSLVLSSSSPTVPVTSVVGPSDRTTGYSENAPLKKKPRVSEPRAQRAKKKQTNIRHNLVKTEYTDPVVGALGNLASVPPSMAQSSMSFDNVHPPGLKEGPLVIQSAFPFSRIAPPSRTPFASASTLAHPDPGEDQQSGLSTNQAYSIYPSLSTSNVTTVNDAHSRFPPGIFRPPKAAAVYQQGPKFHTHFYNNGPANYRNTLRDFGTLPEVRSNHIPVGTPGPYLAERMTEPDLSGRQNIPKQVGFFSQSLAPAIVLEKTSLVPVPMNNYSAYPSSSSVQYTGSSPIAEELSYSPYKEENYMKIDPENIDISTQYNLLVSHPETSKTFPTFYNETLDPSLAPLKHLTDILGEFRTQDGRYTKLVDLQEREGLMECLLDNELARRSPFQAAMGLVLLSKLGLEWDYVP